MSAFCARGSRTQSESYTQYTGCMYVRVPYVVSTADADKPCNEAGGPKSK